MKKNILKVLKEVYTTIIEKYSSIVTMLAPFFLFFINKTNFLVSPCIFTFLSSFLFSFNSFVHHFTISNFNKNQTQMTQVLSGAPFNSLAFGKLLTDDLYSHINQTDNSTVYITPRYNTTGKVELKVDNERAYASHRHKQLIFTIDWCLATIYTKK